jgi:hypothetical protein
VTRENELSMSVIAPVTRVRAVPSEALPSGRGMGSRPRPSFEERMGSGRALRVIARPAMGQSDDVGPTDVPGIVSREAASDSATSLNRKEAYDIGITLSEAIDKVSAALDSGVGCEGKVNTEKLGSARSLRDRLLKFASSAGAADRLSLDGSDAGAAQTILECSSSLDKAAIGKETKIAYLVAGGLIVGVVTLIAFS